MAASQEKQLKVPLSGIRVLDFTAVVAGPFCTTMLADMGAEVVKVEPPRGDDTRSTARYPGREEHEDYFHANNRSKKSVVLDLKKVDHRNAARALATKADVVVENYAPGTAARLGVSWDDLHPVNRRLVYCSLSGFGQEGPYRDRLALDPIVQAISGMMSVTGDPDGPPCLVGGSIGDVISGIFAAYTIVAALYAVRDDGVGRYIDLSMQAAAMAALGNRMGETLQAGIVPRRLGGGNPLRVPANAFMAADGKYVQIMVLNDRHWPPFCQAMGREDWLDDPRFSTAKGRVDHRKEIDCAVAAEIRKCSSDEWVKRLAAERVPVAPIYDYAQAIADEQVIFRKLIRTIGHPTAGRIRVVGPPWKMTGPEAEMRPPPLLGQHTEEVLMDWLCWNMERIAALKHKSDSMDSEKLESGQ